MHYSKGVVTCVGTYNNVDPYDYKPLSWNATLEEFFKDLKEGQIKPTTACNHYKWTILMRDVLAKPEGEQLLHFSSGLHHGPKGSYALRCKSGVKEGWYISSFKDNRFFICNKEDKCLKMSYWKARYYQQYSFVFKDFAIVKM